MRNRKVCTKCKELKKLSDFYVNRFSDPVTVRSRCIVCTRKDRTEYCERNKDKRHEYSVRYRERAAIKSRERYHSNEQARLAQICRVRVRGIVKDKLAGSSSLLGCTASEYRTYIENLFTGGMSWDGVRSGIIHIDHIVPCSFFDLTKEDAQRACFHYSNTRPVWKEDNLRKSKRIFVQDLHRLERVKHLINTKRISIITV